MRTEVEMQSEVERRFRSMADKVPVLIWETDKTGVVSVNGHYLDFFGASLEQVRGMGWAEYLHPEDAQGYIATYAKASAEREAYDYQCRFLNAEGEYRWLRNSGVPLGDGRYVGSSVDVTELVEAQESLRKSQTALRLEREEMQLKLDSTASASWYYDPIRHVVGGDEKMRNLFGLESSEAPTEAWLAAIVEEDRARVGAEFAASLEGAFYNTKYRVTVNGQIRWLHARASTVVQQDRVVRMVGVCEDITREETLAAEIAEIEGRAATEREQVADLLRLESERLQVALITVKATSFDWLPATDAVRWSGMPPFGVNPEKIPTGASSFKYVHPEDRAALSEVLERAGKDRKAYAHEYRALWEDGTTRWIRTSGRALEEPGGSIRFLGVNTDVTERRAAEAALRQTEKLAAVGQLASTIAHEINNPLESVTNLLYICKTAASDPELIQYLTTAEVELRRVSVITNQTLQFHKQRTAPTAISCLDLFSDSLLIFQGRINNSNIQVLKRKRAEQPILCFEGEIRQVMNNLIGNAIDAMKGGGKLLVRSTETTDWRTGRRGLRLTIADTGTGISNDSLSNLFQPFQTTKGIGGTGLGLWVSKEIVERHKGRLCVRTSTKPGRTGTVFALFLPFDPSSQSAT